MRDSEIQHEVQIGKLTVVVKFFHEIFSYLGHSRASIKHRTNENQGNLKRSRKRKVRQSSNRA